MSSMQPFVVTSAAPRLGRARTPVNDAKSGARAWHESWIDLGVRGDAL